MRKMSLVMLGFALLFGNLIGSGEETAVKAEKSEKTESAIAGESASDGLKAIIILYEGRDFEKLVRERYAELHKCKNENEIARVVAMFADRYGDQKRLDEVITGLKQALAATPEISDKGYEPQASETGETASFKTEKGAMKLYKLKTGKWGFHL